MFKAIADFFERRRRLREAFPTLFDWRIRRELRKILADGASKAQLGRTTQNIEVVFIAIFAPDAETYSARAAALAELAHHQDGMVDSVLPVFLVTFGTLAPAPVAAREPFVAAVRAQFSNEVAVAHGATVADFGPFGSPERLAFSVWWPGLPAALRLLANLAPGETRELSP